MGNTEWLPRATDRRTESSVRCAVSGKQTWWGGGVLAEGADPSEKLRSLLGPLPEAGPPRPTTPAGDADQSPEAGVLGYGAGRGNASWGILAGRLCSTGLGIAGRSVGRRVRGVGHSPARRAGQGAT